MENLKFIFMLLLLNRVLHFLCYFQLLAILLLKEMVQYLDFIKVQLISLNSLNRVEEIKIFQV